MRGFSFQLDVLTARKKIPRIDNRYDLLADSIFNTQYMVSEHDNENIPWRVARKHLFFFFLLFDFKGIE